MKNENLMFSSTALNNAIRLKDIFIKFAFRIFDGEKIFEVDLNEIQEF